MKKILITLLSSLISCGFYADSEPTHRYGGLYAEATNSTMTIICDLWEDRSSYNDLQKYNILSKLENSPFVECENLYVEEVRRLDQSVWSDESKFLVAELRLSGTFASGFEVKFAFRFDAEDPNAQFLTSLRQGDAFSVSGKLEHIFGQLNEYGLMLSLSEISLSNEFQESGVMIGLSDEEIYRGTTEAKPFWLR
jgi:hypothetical protein